MASEPLAAWGLDTIKKSLGHIWLNNLHFGGDPQHILRGSKSDLRAWAPPYRGPKNVQWLHNPYVHNTQHRDENQKWLPTPCRIRGRKLGNGHITPAFLAIANA